MTLLSTNFFHQAIGLVTDSGSAPAAYHLARHLEAMGRTAEAVSFYARSSCFNHAIRLAKDHGMDSEVGCVPRVSRPTIFVLGGETLQNSRWIWKGMVRTCARREAKLLHPFPYDYIASYSTFRLGVCSGYR